MLNNPEDMLGIVLRGALGRSGRKRARRATRFITGRGGFLTASTLMAAAGVAWGIYDSLKACTGARVQCSGCIRCSAADSWGAAGAGAVAHSARRCPRGWCG